MYRGSLHGWDRSKFHELCDKKGPTLTLMKSKVSQQIFGGFTTKSWDDIRDFKEDESAVVFNLTTKTTFKLTNPSKAINCAQWFGPCFGDSALSLLSDPLNKEDGGCCYVNEDGKHDVYYDIKVDQNGNSPLTGEGSKQKNCYKSFTCEEFEVYQVRY